MMNSFELPASVLAAIFTYATLGNAQDVATATPSSYSSPNTLLPSTGSGPEYAAACVAEISSYNSAYDSWTNIYNTIQVTTVPLGGNSYIGVKYIENATTLCDGHPRISWDDPVTLSSGTITQTHPITGYSTQTQTFGKAYNGPSPSCSIDPTDCDPLWAAYSSSLQATTTFDSPITTPPCQNVSIAEHYSSLDSSVFGCGKCTIYGTHVQLVYWPVPTSDLTTRDYCASTPTANLTTYNSDAVITWYVGKSLGNYSTSGTTSATDVGHQTVDPNKQTVIADGHAFTQGTAYISIASVWAADRCSKTFGTVTDAVLALPSASVLSLRYQQNHFQYLMETDEITGYPVNYGDFQTPIPWSAWNGQLACAGYWGGPQCDVIDERSYRPQLAIPPQITDLSPDFKDCQMWYNGLYDPPLALTEASTAAAPTNPWAGSSTAATSARPAATAEQNILPTGYGDPNQSRVSSSASVGASHTPDSYHSASPSRSVSSSATSSNPLASYINAGIGGGNSGIPPQQKVPVPANEPWTHTFTINGQEFNATGANNQCIIGGVVCVLDGPPQTIADGATASYGPNGVVIHEHHVYAFPAETGTADDVDTVTATLGGSRYETVVQTSIGAPIVIESHTLMPGGEVATLQHGEVVSAGSSEVVVETEYTLGVSSSTTRTSSETNGASPTRDGAAATVSNSGAGMLFTPHGISSLILGVFIVAVMGA
jgi:hypothetical protein